MTLAVHRLLTVDQLRELLTPGAAGTANWSRRLNALARAGLVQAQRSRGTGGYKLWCATPAGLRAALADRGPRRAYSAADTAGVLGAHTYAVNEVGFAFLRSARTRGEDCEWEHEVMHRVGTGRGRSGRLIADAVVAYERHPDRGRLVRFVEVDRATEPLARLVGQARAYARYHRAGAWTDRYGRWPAVAVVVGANPARAPEAVERRIRRFLESCAADPQLRRLPLLVTSHEQLTADGPWSAVWSRPDYPGTPVDGHGETP